LEPVEVRGWKIICRLLHVNDKRTAKKILEKYGLLEYENSRPVLNLTAFRILINERTEDRLRQLERPKMP
jgi:hypothetical protein